ncbi:hypothetical protein ACMFMG_004709 [Clarireedia jacksonii]
MTRTKRNISMTQRAPEGRNFIADLFEGRRVTKRLIEDLWPQIKRITGWDFGFCPVQAIREWIEEGKEAIERDVSRRATDEPRGRTPLQHPWEETRAREIPASRDSSTATIQPDRIRMRRSVLSASSSTSSSISFNTSSNASSNTSSDTSSTASSDSSFDTDSYVDDDDESWWTELCANQESSVPEVIGTFLDKRW